MQTEGMDACFLFERPSLQTMPLENRPNNSELYHIVMEMKIRESCLQTGTFIYKPGISITKQDFHLQMGSLGLQIGFSAYYLPFGEFCGIINHLICVRTNKALRIGVTNV